MIGFEFRPIAARPHRIGILFTRQGGNRKSVTNLDAFDRVDPHHSARQISVEFGVDRRTPTGGYTVRDTFDHRAERRTGLACPRTESRCHPR